MSVNPNMMTLAEVMDDINSNVDSLGTMYKYKPNSPLAQLFRAAFIEDEAWALPEGVPPYKPYMGKDGTSPTDLLKAILRGRLEYFRKTKPVPTMKREELFIRLLESIHASEAKVLLAVKDQELPKLYPNITYEVLEKFGYLPRREVKNDIRSKSGDVPEAKPSRPATRRRSKPKAEVADESAAEE